MNLTPLQVLGIILAVNGALIGATAQLTDLFGADVAKIIVSVAALGNSVLGGIITAISGQAAQIRNVAAMPGVERISVNTAATPVVAAAAVDPALRNVGATDPATREALKDAARGA